MEVVSKYRGAVLTFTFSRKNPPERLTVLGTIRQRQKTWATWVSEGAEIETGSIDTDDFKLELRFNPARGRLSSSEFSRLLDQWQAKVNNALALV